MPLACSPKPSPRPHDPTHWVPLLIPFQSLCLRASSQRPHRPVQPSTSDSSRRAARPSPRPEPVPRALPQASPRMGPPSQYPEDGPPSRSRGGSSELPRAPGSAGARGGARAPQSALLLPVSRGPGAGPGGGHGVAPRLGPSIPPSPRHQSTPVVGPPAPQRPTQGSPRVQIERAARASPAAPQGQRAASVGRIGCGPRSQAVPKGFLKEGGGIAADTL